MARRGGIVLSVLLILVGMFPHSAEGLRLFLSASDAPVVDPGAVEVELGFTEGSNNWGITFGLTFDFRVVPGTSSTSR